MLCLGQLLVTIGIYATKQPHRGHIDYLGPSSLASLCPTIQLHVNLSAQACDHPITSPLVLIILPPIVDIFEPQHIPNFPIRQRCLPFAHVSGDRRLRTMNTEKLLGRNISCNGVVGGVEGLKP